MDKDESTHLFEMLEERLIALEPRDALRLGRDRWQILWVIVGFALTFGAKYLGGWPHVWVTILGIVLEACALGVLLWRQIRDVTPELVDAKRKFASGLDRDFVDDRQVRDWLDTLPESVRARRLKYLQARLAGLERRYSLLFGAVDKLGILPVMVAVFLQVRALSTLSTWEGLLGAAILLLYLMALWVHGFRLQLERYIRLLAR